MTPNGLPYDYVIDSTAELVPDRPVELYIRNMFDVALNIARASAEQLSRTPGSIKAHIRLVCPFYEHKKDKKRYAEADPEGWKVKDMRGVWGHEALRAIASIEGLPLVALRTGLVYGNGFYQYEGTLNIYRSCRTDSSWACVQTPWTRYDALVVTRFTKKSDQHL